LDTFLLQAAFKLFNCRVIDAGGFALHEILMRNGQSGHIAKVVVADPSWTDLSTVACAKCG